MKKNTLIITISFIFMFKNIQAQLPAEDKKQLSYESSSGGFIDTNSKITKVIDILKLENKTVVMLFGKIEKEIEDEKYLFKDRTGSIAINIDNDDWGELIITPKDKVKIKGVVNRKSYSKIEIDVKQIIKIIN